MAVVRCFDARQAPRIATGRALHAHGARCPTVPFMDERLTSSVVPRVVWGFRAPVWGDIAVQVPEQVLRAVPILQWEDGPISGFDEGLARPIQSQLRLADEDLSDAALIREVELADDDGLGGRERHGGEQQPASRPTATSPRTGTGGVVGLMALPQEPGCPSAGRGWRARRRAA